MKATNPSTSTSSGQHEPGSKFECLPTGEKFIVRPVRAQDVELERQFITGLSPESRRFRFLDTMTEPSEGMLRRLTTVDASREAALAAIDPVTGRFVGVARFSVDRDGAAEIAVAVSDNWQHLGVGTLLAHRLIDIARSRRIKRLYSVDPGDNHAMRQFANGLGFRHCINPDDATQSIYSLNLD